MENFLHWLLYVRHMRILGTLRNEDGRSRDDGICEKIVSRVGFPGFFFLDHR